MCAFVEFCAHFAPIHLGLIWYVQSEHTQTHIHCFLFCSWMRFGVRMERYAGLWQRKTVTMKKRTCTKPNIPIHGWIYLRVNRDHLLWPTVIFFGVFFLVVVVGMLAYYLFVQFIFLLYYVHARAGACWWMEPSAHMEYGTMCMCDMSLECEWREREYAHEHIQADCDRRPFFRWNDFNCGKKIALDVFVVAVSILYKLAMVRRAAFYFEIIGVYFFHFSSVSLCLSISWNMYVVNYI